MANHRIQFSSIRFLLFLPTSFDYPLLLIIQKYPDNNPERCITKNSKIKIFLHKQSVFDIPNEKYINFY